MSVKFIGYIGFNNGSETQSAVRSRALDVDYVNAAALAQEAGGFDRVLIPFGSNSPESQIVAAHAAAYARAPLQVLELDRGPRDGRSLDRHDLALDAHRRRESDDHVGGAGGDAVEPAASGGGMGDERHQRASPRRHTEAAFAVGRCEAGIDRREIEEGSVRAGHGADAGVRHGPSFEVDDAARENQRGPAGLGLSGGDDAQTIAHEPRALDRNLEPVDREGGAHALELLAETQGARALAALGRDRESPRPFDGGRHDPEIERGGALLIPEAFDPVGRPVRHAEGVGHDARARP